MGNPDLWVVWLLLALIAFLIGLGINRSAKVHELTEKLERTEYQRDDYKRDVETERRYRREAETRLRRVRSAADPNKPLD